MKEIIFPYMIYSFFGWLLQNEANAQSIPFGSSMLENYYWRMQLLRKEVTTKKSRPLMYACQISKQAVL